MELRYRSFAEVDDLALNECTIHAATQDGDHWWQLWFHVARDSDGNPDTFVVPVAPRGSYGEVNGRKTWGLLPTEPGEWQVLPSINVLETRETHPGQHETIGSLWHRTPRIIGIPDGERWMHGT